MSPSLPLSLGCALVVVADPLAFSLSLFALIFVFCCCLSLLTQPWLVAHSPPTTSPPSCYCCPLTAKPPLLMLLLHFSAEFLQAAYDKNVSECQKSGTRKDPNQIFFQTVGGRKKGSVFGLGTSADELYFERSSRCGHSSSSTCTPSMISQLSTRLEESERKREVMERERLKAERARLQKEEEREAEFAEMKRALERYVRMFSQCRGFFPFTQDPGDDSGSGGGNRCTFAI
ncbi:hypothetical protein BVRB_6g148880 [Beta vulgaris subsp. vulgaris]|nr:hypothetical protein BVRB_6g148880 [Beta vulgaris subsp. vulgaris]